MKRLLLSVLIAGCARRVQQHSTEEQKGAAVEDAQAGQPAPVVVDRAPVKPVDPSADRQAADRTIRSPAVRSRIRRTSSPSAASSSTYDSNLVKDEYKPVVAAHARYLQQNGGSQDARSRATPTSAAAANTTSRSASAAPTR